MELLNAKETLNKNNVLIIDKHGDKEMLKAKERLNTK